MKRPCWPIWIASVSLWLTLFGCQKVNLQTPTGVLERGLPDETSYNVSVTNYLDNKYEYQLEAAKIERFSDRRLLIGYKVTLTTYDKDSKLNSVIKADTTIVDEARNLVLANGHAKMTTPNGSLSTPNIAWDRAVDEITAPKQVLLTRQGNVMRGQNLRTNSKLSFVEMEQVSAEGRLTQQEIDW